MPNSQPPSRSARPNLLWPGDHRAEELFDDEQVLAAMLAVERHWLAILVELGIAPADAADDIHSVAIDVDDLAIAAEDAGNPAVPLVALLREKLPSPAASWVHRGLTSQDVVDSAVMLCAQDALNAVSSSVRQQVSCLATLMETHRHTAMLARTLTQPAISSTFGVRAAGWCTSVLDAADALQVARRELSVQVGGAAGTLAAVAEMARGRGLADPPAAAIRAGEMLADRLGLHRSLPWHTSRRPVTALGDAMVTCTDSFGRIARDVLESARTDIAELREGAQPGRGSSSTMPGKRNPVLSVLIRRAAIGAPPLAATLHHAAAESHEERPDGAWHAEWDTLRILTRRTVVAASQTAELLAGLDVNTAAMAASLAAHLASHADVDPEQRAMATLVGVASAETYWGAADLIIDRVRMRAERYLFGADQTSGPEEDQP